MPPLVAVHMAVYIVEATEFPGCFYGSKRYKRNKETTTERSILNLFMNEYISDKWQTIWNGARFDKLREVEPIIKRPRVIHKLSRREEMEFLNGLHTAVGHPSKDMTLSL